MLSKWFYHFGFHYDNTIWFKINNIISTLKTEYYLREVIGQNTYLNANQFLFKRLVIYNIKLHVSLFLIFVTNL